MSASLERFLALVPAERVAVAAWDPERHRTDVAGEPLARFADAVRLSRGRGRSPFRAIAYRDVAPGDELAFSLAPAREERGGIAPSAGEGALLLGTLRAYLGNVIVTPRAEWLGLEPPIRFRVGSEFLEVTPRDGCVFFWWALLRSPAFRASLPLGGGGTRPRLSPEALLSVPVRPPALERRRELDRLLAECAEDEWRASVRRASVLAGAGLDERASVARNGLALY